jgi:hypothetical protein
MRVSFGWGGRGGLRGTAGGPAPRRQSRVGAVNASGELAQPAAGPQYNRPYGNPQWDSSSGTSSRALVRAASIAACNSWVRVSGAPAR